MLCRVVSRRVVSCRVVSCRVVSAGKSSIIQALFRIVEAHRGRVCVSGVDSRRVPLSRLRAVLAIIPQDPVLLRGSIR
jgi:ATP-binding cassette, subfamily C (CFTR/MRP), member 1